MTMTFEAFQKQFHYEMLDPQQAAAAAATEGPVLLLAVPGSGKTTALLARLGYLVCGRGVDPARILTCTYTVAATGELRARFGARFGAAYAGRMEFRTINGVCARIVARYARDGRTAFSLVADEGRRYALLRQAWLAEGHDFPTESDLRGMATAIAYLKNQMLTDDQADAVCFRSGEGLVPIGPIYRAYKAAMRRNRWMDYDDQMVYALAILRRCPDILAELRARYTYFCVDEAQDTSRIQHRILALLAAGSRNLFMVGDEDQSIYGFRAACPQALMEFERDWPGARVLLMERNYRSTPQIVTVADRFIRLNQLRRAKRMQATRPDGAPVEIRRCDSRTRQYECIAEMAREAARRGNRLAVLYRNNETALPLIDLLDRQGTPYQARGMDALFFGSRIVGDVKALFRLARHPEDHEAYLRLYYKIGIYMKKAAAELPTDGKTSVFQLYRQLGEEQAPAHLKHLLAERARQLDQIARADDPAAGIRMLSAQMGYGDYLERNGIDPFRLEILSNLAEREASIDSFLRRLDRLEEIARTGGAEGAGCILSTIHSSKGLEYDHVVVADAVVGVLPADLSRTEDPAERQRQEEEERRLFYVALTRAKDRLTLMAVERSASPFVRYLQAMLEQRPAVQTKRPAADAMPGPRKRPDVDLTAWQPGCTVEHRSFGRGVLRQRRDEYGEFDFPCGKKTLALPFAIRMGMLRMAGAKETNAENQKE